MQANHVLRLALLSATLCAGPALAQQNSPPPPANSGASSAASNGASSSNNAAPSTSANNNTANPAAMGSGPAAMGTKGTNTANTANTNAAAPGAATPAVAPPATTAAQPAPAAEANNNNNGPSGSLQKYDNEWRSSKVIGATVFNSSGQDIGSIDDLLMGDDGKIDKAVISTGGGVLGIGAKLVAVPFDQLKFEPSVGNNGSVLKATEAPANGGANGSNANATVAANNAGAANETHPTYYSVVLPGATKDSLSKEQEFKYASNK